MVELLPESIAFDEKLLDGAIMEPCWYSQSFVSRSSHDVLWQVVGGWLEAEILQDQV